MLGDANITKQGNKNAFYRIERSAADREYLEWHFQEFRSLVVKNSPTYMIRVQVDTGKIFRTASFYTRNLLLLTKLYKLWYPNAKKIVPKKLELTPLIIAIWFCDDGSIYYNKSSRGYVCKFATHGFTKNEVKQLVQKAQ